MLTIHTAPYSYKGPDRLDISRDGADRHFARTGEAPLGSWFAPSRELLTEAKRRGADDGDAAAWAWYEPRFVEEMRKAYANVVPANAAWHQLLDRQGSVTLVCFCPGSERCHRTIVARLLGEAAKRWEIPVTIAGERGALEGSMKAVTLHEPWATFCRLLWKKHETRSWGTRFRGELAIHAAKTPAHLGEAPRLARAAGFDPALLPAEDAWPLGCVVCVATVGDCFEVSGRMALSVGSFEMTVNGKTIAARTEAVETRAVTDTQGRTLAIPPADMVLGDLSPGRFGWRLDGTRALAVPVPAKGAQGLWDLPVDVAAQVRAQLERAPVAAGGR